MTRRLLAPKQVGILLVFFGSTLALGARQDAFVYVGPDYTQPPGQRIRMLTVFDPSTGSSTVKERANRSEQPLRAELMDLNGNHLALRTVSGATATHPAGIEPALPNKGPRHCFEQATVPLSIKASLSPDGNAVALFHPRFGLSIDDGESCHRHESRWASIRNFAWSRDSRKVAFYYAETSLDDDVYVQKHGVAVLETNGNLTVVQEPADDLATPMNPGAKGVPPGWSKENRYLYFTGGVAADDKLREIDGFDTLYRPTAVYRLNVTTHARETLALGEFGALSPADDYVIVSRYPVKRADGAWELGTVQFVLDTREIVNLPEEVRMPQLSPSGAYAACAGRQKLLFFDTHTWNLTSDPVVLTERGIQCSDWYAQFRWLLLKSSNSTPSAD